jgi:hypothetical protein
MIFSNRSIPENLDFSFNGKSVPITTSYKHLGVTFSNDAKWKTHVHKMGTDFPLKEKSRFSGMLRLEKIMISVLSGLNDISHFFYHRSISFKS